MEDKHAAYYTSYLIRMAMFFIVALAIVVGLLAFLSYIRRHSGFSP